MNFSQYFILTEATVKQMKWYLQRDMYNIITNCLEKNKPMPDSVMENIKNILMQAWREFLISKKVSPGNTDKETYKILRVYQDNIGHYSAINKIYDKVFEPSAGKISDKYWLDTFIPVHGIPENFLPKKRKMLKPSAVFKYDLGGGNQPESENDPSCVVVDIMSYDSFDHTNPYIEADLNKYIKLTPVKEIYSCQAVKYISNLNNLAKTINDALVPKGKICLYDGHTNGIKKNQQLIDILCQTYKFKIIEHDTETAEVSYCLQK